MLELVGTPEDRFSRDEAHKAVGCNYPSRNNLSQVRMIHCTLFPGRYSLSICCLLNSSALVVLRHVGCLWITGTLHIFRLFNVQSYKARYIIWRFEPLIYF